MGLTEAIERFTSVMIERYAPKRRSCCKCAAWSELKPGEGICERGPFSTPKNATHGCWSSIKKQED